MANVKRSEISEVMRHLARQRAKKLSVEERERISRKGGKKAWAGVGPEERSAEMKRRAAKRKKNKAKKR